jgi:hypothetical protein
MAVLDLEILREEYRKATDPQKKEEFKAGIKQMIKVQTGEEMMASLKVIDNRISELKTIVELGDIADMASMSYIAKKYFNKSRSWLYQRLNGNTVHGKPARFTAEEQQTLAKALDDMSRKFKEKSLSIMNG